MTAPTRGPLQSGQTYLDEYEVLEGCGQGSFGWVYRVRRGQAGVDLALKISNSQIASTEAENRFWREVAILKMLRHGHVVRLFDAGKAPDQRTYIVMEYLEGQPLDDAHDPDTPMEPLRALSIVRQACLGVGEAHLRDIVHRDLKPSNIFLLGGDFVKVIDFGLARAYGGGGLPAWRLTAPQVIAGTVRYMSPEQTRDSALGPPSDVYALGLMLYELLLARTPFHPGWKLSEVKKALKKKPAEWLALHQNHPPLPFRQALSPARPPAILEPVVLRALSKNPSDRYKNAAEMAAALERVGATLGPDWRRDSGVSPARRRLRALGYAPRVVVIKPDDSIEAVPVKRGRVLIGTSSRCHIRLTGDDVLSVHAALECTDPTTAPQLVPVPGARINVWGKWVEGPTRLEADQEVSIGENIFFLERRAWRL
jgi:serine/threonine-protein kinase